MLLDNAPDKGTMYALYVDRVVYKSYSKGELLNNPYLEDKLLELHLFDKDIEYRYINARNKTIETVISKPVSKNDYVEKVYVQSKVDEEASKDSKCIEVVNYIKYDENDLLNIYNYRLKEMDNE